MDESTRQVRIQEWMKIIQTWSESGQPKNQWCSDHGVSLRQFYYWQRIIRQELYEAAVPDTELVPVKSTTPCLVDITPQSARERPAAAEESQSMAVIKTDKVEIHVPVNAGEALLNCIRGIICHAL